MNIFNKILNKFGLYTQNQMTSQFVMLTTKSVQLYDENILLLSQIEADFNTRLNKNRDAIMTLVEKIDSYARATNNIELTNLLNSSVKDFINLDK